MTATEFVIEIVSETGKQINPGSVVNTVKNGVEYYGHNATNTTLSTAAGYPTNPFFMFPGLDWQLALYAVLTLVLATLLYIYAREAPKGKKDFVIRQPFKLTNPEKKDIFKEVFK